MGSSLHYALVLQIEESATNEQVVPNKNVSFGLEVVATQHTEPEPIVLQDVLAAQRLDDLMNSKIYFQLNDASGGLVDFSAYTYKLNGEAIEGKKSTRMEAYQFDVTDKSLSGDVKLEIFEADAKVAEFTVNFG